MASLRLLPPHACDPGATYGGEWRARTDLARVHVPPIPPSRPCSVLRSSTIVMTFPRGGARPAGPLQALQMK